MGMVPLYFGFHALTQRTLGWNEAGFALAVIIFFMLAGFVLNLAAERPFTRMGAGLHARMKHRRKAVAGGAPVA